MAVRALGAALLATAACAPVSNSPGPKPNGDRLLQDITTLASDSFQGRRPGTIGEERTLAYLSSQFAAAGLVPGNPDGSWTQAVDLVGITSVPTLSIQDGVGKRTLAWKTDYVAQSRRETASVSVENSEIVFVGYGVTAPEYNWDDYKGMDVRGKTLVMLVNDPPVPLATDSTTLDPAFFRANAMTYYGRWTYKFEEATRRGAAAVLVVHQTIPASYPWEVVESGWTGERMDVSTPDGHAGRVAVEGWLSLDAATKLFRDAGLDFTAQEQLARSQAFQPVSLRASATFDVTNSMRKVATHNFIAKLPGTDPVLRNEYVIYTAHWDHFGIGKAVNGDSIYNGARDNASGTAALIELGRTFAAAGAPKRTVLFLAVTAEEQGLLGSKWYADNPLYPLRQTLADFNIDVLNTWGATSDVTVVGSGSSTLEDLLATAATAEGRTVAPDPEPEAGGYYRSDHFEFAKRGVPSLYLDQGTQFVGKADDFGKTRRDEWTAHIYHQPSDQVDPAWDLSGAVADLALLYTVGREVANTTTWPTWKDGTEFKAVRDQMLGTTP